MSRLTRTASRSLAAFVAAGLGSTLFAVAPAAHAASSVGGQITRSEVLARAQSWVDQGVPYSESANHSDGNGSYREDCSGFVSMAWHLNDSYVTQTLHEVSNPISRSQLAPGDILDYEAAHTFLFANWTNQGNGDFTYYAESNSHYPTHGPTSANINDSTLEGWPNSYYTAFRYKNIVDDPAPAPSRPARTAVGDFNSDGKLDVVGIDANNNMMLYTGDGQGHVGGGSPMLGTTGLWANFKAIATGDFNGDGKTDVAGIDANNNLMLYTGDGQGHLGGGTPMLGTNGLWANFKAITAGDFTGSGHTDIAGIDAYNNLMLYRGDGQGHLAAGTPMLGTNGLWANFKAITAGDFTGTGHLGIAGIDANNNLKFYQGDGNGNVGGGINMLGDNGLWTGFHSVMAGDFGTGHLSIAGIDANNNLKLYTGDGQGHVSGGTDMLGGNGLWAGF
ncbi:VCBS repeat-containing protein [Kitasatospora sp. NBC_01250]|uniref:C40 family peptidase n=1 Tax=Kitasatospora sp. NBC_01250 TaxID=2903571 RepID=UPI002E37C9B3|nr:VCBS repeat-containing protein [Kitasatospora sp. NBC_01250]